jgi:heme exporter protein B
MIDGGASRRVFAPLLWLVFLFSVTASVNRGNEQELEGRAFEGLLLSGFSPVQMYVSKVLVTWVYLCLAFGLVTACMGVLLNQTVWSLWGELLLIGGATSLGVSALMVILVVMASTSRVKGVLLPLISLPLLFPVFFAATELSAEVLARGNLDLGSVWLSILVCADVVYLALGLNLFAFVIRE